MKDDSDERFRKLIFPYLYDLFVHTSKSDDQDKHYWNMRFIENQNTNACVSVEIGNSWNKLFYNFSHLTMI
jgi:hypothetical protein